MRIVLSILLYAAAIDDVTESVPLLKQSHRALAEVPLKANADMCTQPLPAQDHSCTDKTLLFYYDFKRNYCRPFSHGACSKSPRLMKTANECREKCIAAPGEDICNIPHTSGHACHWHIPMYTFNQTMGSCMGFVYGGCHGTANRFWTLSACMQHCPDTIRVDRCSSLHTSLPYDCPDSHPEYRYFYNATTRTCEKYEASRCFRTQNSFDTMTSCTDECGRR
ncbi:BPTI/Kunitz domain-containing protein-like [Ornithodoros turicata]|uniref:BPTI/Kunitz domain-containing protein-like n=1 Tax=Ornithodoros turicata TaxID=34597 RepID=UPI003139322F